MTSTAELIDQYITQGGATMFVLFPLSIYTLGIIIQKSIELRKARMISNEIIIKAKSVHDKASLENFIKLVENHPSPLAKIIIDYIEMGKRGESMDPRENLVPIDDQAEILYQSLSPISTSYIIGPLVGVLGTTVGIMETFRQFAISGKRDMTALVSAIDKSLITTMWGLIIAVPAYFCFALLQGKIFEYERKTLPKIAGEIMSNLSRFVSKE